MANITKGSITSSYPDSIPSFTAQSETNDPAAEDSTLAEGRDANKWSAEIQAVAECLGPGGRGQISVSGVTATVEGLDYVYRGTQYAYAGTSSLSLYSGQVNYVYLDPSDNTAKVSTSGWPTTPHLRLALWDDTGGTPSLTDSRPHDLRFAAEKPIFGTTAAWQVDSGTTTITSGNTSVAITYNLTYSSAPVLVVAHKRPSDATLRKIGHTNNTTTGATIHIDSAAPASGCEVHWIAIGLESSGGSGS